MPPRPRTGRPAHDHRTVLNGMPWMLRTGAPWRDLPDRYGNWQTVHSRFRRWRDAGIWDRILTTLQREAALAEALDGSLAMIDGSNMRAHRQSAGATKEGRHLRPRPQPGRLGEQTPPGDRAGGKSIVCALTAGQRHERPEAIPLLERTLGWMWQDAVAGHTVDRSSNLRKWRHAREIEAVFPKREDEMPPHDYDRDTDRARPVIEQTINRLKRYWRVATRYEKLTSSYLAMVTIAMILEWLSQHCKHTLEGV